MEVINSRGQRVRYDEKKIKKSIQRTGASNKEVEEIEERISREIYPGITTRQIYEMVDEELKELRACLSCRYSLRPAILKFGPAGYKFEKYVRSILEAHRYEAHVPTEELEGACVMHEVDVIAEKDGRRIFIEAKFRNDYKDNVNLKDTMATWSRFIDLVDGSAVGKAPHFDEAWIITNARFSDRARKFGGCKGMRMIGWNYPEERSFSDLVDIESLYPVTVIEGLAQSEIEALSKEGWMLCKELIDRDPEEVSARLGLPEERVAEIIKSCEEVVGG